MPNDTKQNSNQVNPTNDLPVSTVTPTQDTPPVLAVEDVVPPMPQVGLPKTEEVKNEEPMLEVKNEDTTSGSAAPSDDIKVTPVVMGTTPKKKFGNGKVIATILGLLVLIGGAGAGTYLVQKNQDIRERANVIECFPAGTKITTDSGTKSIEDFVVGDKVLSENLISEKKELSSTTKLWKLFSLNMCSVSFENRDILKLTNPHPLYTQDGWKAINVEEALKHNPQLSITKLTAGDSVKKEDGSWNKITDISCKYGLFRVYNLAVDTNNNYFAEKYLVHNKDVVSAPGQIIYYNDQNNNIIRDDVGNDGDSNTDDGAGNTNADSSTSNVNYNTATDVDNCGVVGARCGGSEICTSGTCVSYCNPTDALRGYCSAPPNDPNGCMIEGDTTGIGDCDRATEYCHIQGGQTGTYGVCVSKSSFIDACTGDGRQVSENSAHPSSVTCCEHNYISNPNGYGCVQGSASSTTTGGDTPPGDTPSITASCQNVKAYNTSWTLLTNAQLSTLTVGSTVNFCVAGVATGGSFDKAKFTINSVAQAETTTVRPSSTDFCQSYVIPAGTTTFNVTAQIHHVTLGWK